MLEISTSQLKYFRMKRKDDLGVGGYIFVTVIFAIMAFVTFQSNDWKPEALTIGMIILNLLHFNCRW